MEAVDWTVGTMLLEVVVLAAGVEALVVRVLIRGCTIGERGAEVPLGEASVDACLGNGALVMAVRRDGEGGVRAGSLMVGGCEALKHDC